MFSFSKTFNAKYSVETVQKLFSNFDKLPFEYQENDKKKCRKAQKCYLEQLLEPKPTKYTFGNNRTFGRLYGSPFQFLKKELRNAICKDYVDVDMKNAQPRILLWWCDQKILNVPVLKEYCFNRNKYYHLKQSVITIINGGTVPNLKSETDLAFLTSFADEITKIHSIMLGKKQNKDNAAGKLCNKILETSESKILDLTVKFLDERQLSENLILMFDGFLIPKELFSQELLTLINQEVFKQTGIPVEYIEKEMVSFNIPYDWKTNVKEIEKEISKKTVLMLLDELVAEYPDYIKNINGTPWIFDKTTGMWTKNSLGIFMKLCADKFGRNTPTGGNPKNIRELFSMCQSLPDQSDFFAEAVKLRKGKVLYRNGIKNLETDTFETDFNCNYFFTKRIHRDYNPIRNESIITKTRKVLFEDPHKPEIGEEYIKALGLGMTGRNLHEAQYENLGTGSNGKSLMMEALLEAFPGYVEPFSITTIRVSPNAKANEHNDGLVMTADTRIGFSSESAAGMNVDSEQFKRLCTQEPFYARECGEKQVKIKPEMTLFSFGQNPLVFDKIDTAVQRRRKGFPWNKTFKKVVDGSLDFLRTELAYQALDHIIQDGYNNYLRDGFINHPELELFKEEINDEQDQFSEVLENTYTILNDKEDREGWIKSTEVYNSFKHLKMSDWAIKKRFIALGVECKQVRSDQGKGMYFKGLKKINHCDF